eukprot:INCI13265.1.p1 GENE.INCI13265.1~~INCI13265.1.p1  ORF type:complete len:306 (+),score=46.76 INCI13265.1:271-1188(+)
MPSVVIVGGSFAGLSLALALQQRRLKCPQQVASEWTIHVLESRSEEDVAETTGCVRFHGGRGLIAQLGLSDDHWRTLAQTGEGVRQRGYFNAGRLPVQTALVSRAKLLQVLKEHLTAGQLRYSTRISGLQLVKSSSGADEQIGVTTVSTTSSLRASESERCSDDAAKSSRRAEEGVLMCDYIVAADGLMSPTRSLVAATESKQPHLRLGSRILLIGDAARQVGTEWLFGFFRYSFGVSQAMRDALSLSKKLYRAGSSVKNSGHARMPGVVLHDAQNVALWRRNYILRRIVAVLLAAAFGLYLGTR